MNTRDKLIEYTAQAVRKKGFYGTGIREILTKTEVPKGSLYHHFPTGKEGLVREALLYSGQEMLNKIKSVLKKQSAIKGLQAIVDLVSEELVSSNFSLADPLVIVALEAAEEWPDLRRVSSGLYVEWAEILVKFLEKKKISSAERKADLFLAQVQGALILAKIHRDKRYLDQVIEQVEILVNSGTG